MCDADKRELFMFFSEATTPLIHQQAQIYVPSYRKNRQALHSIFAGAGGARLPT